MADVNELMIWWELMIGTLRRRGQDARGSIRRTEVSWGLKRAATEHSADE
jgi:hypothetical protein